ncbi:hypothetical protein PGTUg99_003941 [Puccinia graminis f. sp. tritici]|uniref:Uncharacterized protein n=1 Tax=Puccinia graminis f. sp. tritici TaxID=56615 RepID=A0A5B0QDN3_PUCGR|nr:hypothetical protein PGTUg99_003941 [Puccinia graminis f. sp. tritici]
MIFSKVKGTSVAATGFNQQIIELSPEEEEDIKACHQKPSASTQSSSTTINSSEEEVFASLIFAIPLPKPTDDYYLPDNPTAPLLLYTLPRSVYEKPPKNPETDKRPREKIVKKIQRSWQKSIQQAEDIKRGDYPRPTWMKKFIGGAFWFMAACLRFITISDAQMLARLPPVRKIGPIQILYSKTSFVSDKSHMLQKTKPVSLTDDQARKSIMNALSQARKQAKIRAIISGCLLPAALAAEIYVPLVFEITLVFFVVQWRSWKKAKFLVEHNNDQAIIPTRTPNDLETGNPVVTKSSRDKLELQVGEVAKFQKINELIYRSCSKHDPLKFPCLKENTPSVEAFTSQDIVIDCTAVHQCTRDTKDNSQSTVIKPVSVPDRKAELESVPIIINTGILSTAKIEKDIPSKTKSSFDGIVITIPASDEDNEADCGLGGETEKRAPHSRRGADVVVNKELAKIEPTLVAATSVPSNTRSSSSVAISAPPGVAKAMPPELHRGQKITTRFDTNQAPTSPVPTSEIARPTLPSGNQSHQPKAVPHTEIASLLIKTFQEYLPVNIHARHEFNERRIAEDFNRFLNRRTKEYVKTLKKMNK